MLAWVIGPRLLHQVDLMDEAKPGGRCFLGIWSFEHCRVSVPIDGNVCEPDQALIGAVLNFHDHALGVAERRCSWD